MKYRDRNRIEGWLFFFLWVCFLGSPDETTRLVIALILLTVAIVRLGDFLQHGGWSAR